MVYPEKLTLDQVSGKSSNSARSWCSEPIGYGCAKRVSRSKSNNIEICAKIATYNECNNKSILVENSVPTSANRQFIQDRIRHLVDAFSYRAQAVRERIQMPPTPSSISSHDTLDETTIKPLEAKIIDLIEKEEPMEEKPDTVRKKSIFDKAGYVYDTKVIDPQGNIYVLWMSIAATFVLYNTFVIPLRSAFPYQTPENTPTWMFFDYFADLIYIIDITLIQPRIMFLAEGFWMTDFRFTRHNYMRKCRFKLDLLSILPLDIFYILLG
ncbi:hypothetical protein AMK59_7201, partial [Oryctes borbonicus]